jgi:L-fuculose-phosphate aldolase
MDEAALRSEIVERCLEMNRNGINQGMSGNISARCSDGLLVTPSSVPYERLRPEMIVRMDFEGAWEGDLRPSSEWRFHLDILRHREDVNAVVHAHPPHATAVSILARDIPPVHYMVAVAGGRDIRCARYATVGTQSLSDSALEALEGRQACLLANHGMIACGFNLGHAMWLAVEVETIARQYLLALQGGEPRRLTDAELDDVFAQFKSYAKKS